MFDVVLLLSCLCRALHSQHVWMSLLELFLNPKAALAQSPIPLDQYPAAAAELALVEPDYGSACRVLNAEGASLNPLQLLGALPAGMPLHLAGNVLSRMLSGLQHRHRQGQVVRCVHCAGEFDWYCCCCLCSGSGQLGWVVRQCPAA